MAGNKRAGILYFKIDGEIKDAKGNFTYNLGADRKEAIVGADRVHGYKVTPQVPYIEGEITDKQDFDIQKLLDIEDATITLELRNGKTVVVKEAWYAAEGNIGTEEGNIQVRFEGKSATEI